MGGESEVLVTLPASRPWPFETRLRCKAVRLARDSQHDLLGAVEGSDA